MGVKSGIFKGLGGFAGGVVRYGAVVDIQTRGERSLTMLGRRLEKLNKGFLRFGVSTIFLDRLIQSFTRAFSALNSVLGVGRITETAEKFTRLSKFTGVSTKNLQAFTAAASKVGAEIDDVSDLFQTFTERVDDLRSGTEKGITDDFKKFGMDKDTFAGANDGLSQYLRLLQAIDKLPPQRRMPALEKLLGGDLARKFGQLGNAADVLREMRKAVKQGAVIDDPQIAQALRLASVGRSLRRSLQLVSDGLFFVLEPALSSVGEVFSELLFDVGMFLRLMGPKLSMVTALYVRPFVDSIKDIKTSIETTLKPIGEFLARFGLGLSVLAVAGVVVATVFQEVLLTFMGIVTAIAAAAIVAEDLFIFFTTGGGLFGRFLKDSPLLQGALNNMAVAGEVLGLAFADLAAAANELFTGPLGPVMIQAGKFIVATLAGLAVLLANIVRLVTLTVRVFVRLASVLVDLTATIVALGEAAGNPLASAMLFAGGFTPTGDPLGLIGNMGSALLGYRGTNTERLFFGTQQPAPNFTVNQTNNINATSSNPSAVVSSAVGASGRAIGSMTGGAP